MELLSNRPAYASVPDKYVFPPEKRAALRNDAPSSDVALLVIDLQRASLSDASRRRLVADEIVKACKEFGFFQLDDETPNDVIKLGFDKNQRDEIYYATLNQTNVGDNNNKFYIIQALESDAGGSFMVFNRWGRVGARGQQKLHPCSTRDEAIYEFEGKFEDKTKNTWSNHKNFECYAEKYTWLEMDYGEVDKETTQVQKKGSMHY